MIRAPEPPRSAFTLVELLVVTAIIGLLASLILAGGSWALKRSRVLVTEGRMQSIATGIQTAEASGDRVQAIMARGLGDRLEIGTFRTVASLLVPPDNWPAASSFKFNADREEIRRRLPPNTAYRYGNKGLVGEESAQGDKFLMMHMPWWMAPDDAEVLPDAALRTGERPYRMWYRNRWPMSWPTSNWRTWTPASGWDPRTQPLHDPVAAAFADAEATSGPPYSRILTDAAAYHPPRWMHPWGKEPLHLILGDWGYDRPTPLQAALGATQPAYQRWPHPLGPAGTAMSSRSYAKATLTPETETGRTLADLGPLETVSLLQFAGVLAEGRDGVEAYASQRSPALPWNDRWGNPLVVAHALWMAPRWDPVLDGQACSDGFDVHRQRVVDTNGDGGLDESWFLCKPRDHLARLAKAKYGTTRALYLSVGAAGPQIRDTVLAEAEAAGADLVFEPGRLVHALRALWLQIAETTRAGEFGDAEMAIPQSRPVRSGKLPGGFESWVLLPVEVR